MITVRIVLFLLLVLGAGGGWTGAAPESPRARFSGCFYYFAGREHWPAERWAQELDRMDQLGLRTIVLLGTVKEDQAAYPTRVAGLHPTEEDPLALILTEADRRGMEVLLEVYDTREYWRNTTPEYYDRLAGLTMDLASEQHARYGAHPSLKGFYIVPEFWFPARGNIRQTWVDDYLTPVTRHIKSLRIDYAIVCTPFVIASPQFDGMADEIFWYELLHQVPALDGLIMQDGIGANEQVSRGLQGRPYGLVRSILFHTDRACHAAHRPFAVDLEAFEAVGVFAPPHFSRIAHQLTVAGSFSNRILAFEWSYLSPGNSLPALAFWHNYQRYLARETLLENILQDAKPRFFTPPPAVGAQHGPELKPAGGSQVGAEPMRMNWPITTPVAVELDLGRVMTGIEGLAASFEEDEKGHRPPRQIQAALSEDGRNWRDVGAWGAPLAPGPGPLVYERWLPVPARARYVRFTLIPGDGPLRVSGLAAWSTVPELASRGCNCLCSVPPAALFPNEMGKLTDGDTAARWYAQVGWHDPGQPVAITLDLGTTKDLTRIEALCLRKDKDHVRLPRSLRADISTDGEHFAPLGPLQPSGTARDGASILFAFNSAMRARYVRFQFEPADGWLMVSEVRAWTPLNRPAAISLAPAAMEDIDGQKRELP